MNSDPASAEQIGLICEGEEFRVFGYPDDHIFSQIKRRGEFYEPDLLRFVHEVLAEVPEGVIVDVGANLGNHTLYFAGVMGRRVIAIEPEPANFELLVQNVKTNGLDDLVDMRAVAAWDHIEDVRLTQALPHNRGTFRAVQDPEGGVPAVPLDALLKDTQVALLKIDVEGAEARVLDGAVGLLERCRPLIVTESHGATAVASIVSRLGPLGYRRAAVMGLSDNYLWVAPSSSASAVQDAFSLENTRRFERLVAHNSDVHGRRLIAITEASTSLGADIAHLGEEVGSIRSALSTHCAQVDQDSALLRRDTAEVVRGLSTELLEGAKRLFADVSKRLTDIEEQQDAVRAHVAEAVESAVDRQLLRAEDLRSQVDEARTAWVRLAAAYQALSDRYARKHPDEWSRVAAARAVFDEVEPVAMQDVCGELADGGLEPARGIAPASGSYSELGRRVLGDRVRIGIASMPGRETALAAVLSSLSSQADEVFVYLNGMDSVPAEVQAHANVRFFTGADLGDRGKFLFLDGYEGYYLTCDDDIEYPRYYVSSIIDGIERYARKAIVGWHGSQFSEDFEKFYDAKSRRVLSFRFLRGKDTPVHLLGTGVSGFHTDTVRPEIGEFEYPNMADAFLAIHAQRRGVPMVVLAHEGGEATPIETPGSISAASLGKDKRGVQVFDVAATVTRLVKAQMPWKIFSVDPVFSRPKRRVAIVGRTDVARWRKGGILKSCHLTRDMLLSFGWDAHMADIETGDPFGLEGFSPELVMVYVGDPERPDFARVIDIVEFHARLGRAVLVNLSDNGMPSRHQAINRRMSHWLLEFGGRVRQMTFTDDLSDESIPGSSNGRNACVTIPKTLVYEDVSVASFGRSSAVFVGDVAKLSDPQLLGGDARPWLEAIRRAVPNAPIVGLRQYTPKYSVDLGLDEIWPFLNGREMVDKMLSVRVAVSIVKYATFEMVPVEIAAMGIPVFYRRMPQSLSHYLGQAALAVDSPSALEARLAMVYGDPLVWRGYSEAGARRAMSGEFQRASAAMLLALESFIREVQVS